MTTEEDLKAAQRIGICIDCPHRGPVQSTIICTVDGRSIHEHAGSAQCPKGKYASLPILKMALHGAAGIARAVTGTGGASKELIDKRTAICGGCEHAQKSLAGLLDQCSLCGCSTWAKIRNADEKCPAGKW